MYGTVLAFLGIIVILIGVLIFFAYQLLKRGDSSLNDKKLLEVRLKDLRDTMDNRFAENTNAMSSTLSQQFESSRKLVKDITKELTEVKETSKEMLSFTDQLQKLKKILENPQKRGFFGESILNQVLQNTLPPNTYKIQYTFKNGVRADAVIMLGKGKKLAIDAKFSLDAYKAYFDTDDGEVKAMAKKDLKSALKERIKETSKYIFPEEGTLDLAFMFIPSESLYYELLSTNLGSKDNGVNLIEFAFKDNRVIIVSPTTLLAYLQTVLMGLRSLQVEENTQIILKNVNSLSEHLKKYEDNFGRVGNSLSTVVNHYNKAQNNYKHIDKDIAKIMSNEASYVPESINQIEAR